MPVRTSADPGAEQAAAEANSGSTAGLQKLIIGPSEGDHGVAVAAGERMCRPPGAT